MPLLGIGGNSFNGLGDYYAIGLGYCSLPTRKYCCEVGVVITNKAGGECGDLVFSLRNTTVSTDIAVERMRITSTRNVGIGTSTVNNILQVGDGGRLKIGSGITDFTLIGTKDYINDNTTNTKIFINGNTCNYAGSPGSIQHFATGSGGHIFL